MAGKQKMERRLDPFKLFLYLSLVGFLTLMFVGYTVLTGDTYEDKDNTLPDFKDAHDDDSSALREHISDPVILWWTPFTGDPGTYRKCGENMCFFTVDRHYYRHKQTKVLMFYGTDINVKDLPLPREPHHEWALMHEESPKNDYILTQPEFLPLFNHTSTFKRESDFPLTLQYVESVAWLESNKYLVSTEDKSALQRELAPVFYAQSDCNVPSDRDSFVEMFMEYMKVDSYGSCVHNRDLPTHLVNPLPGMEHEDFFRLQAKYKFSFAMENAVCDDYITEKLWRPLMLGSVPIIHGSPKIKELLPDEHSAIIVSDFKSPEELAEYIQHLNNNDEEYNKYLQWKKTGITNKSFLQMMKDRSWSIVETWKEGRSNFVEDFECFVCDRVHKNLKRRQDGEEELKFIADHSHLQCPVPVKFAENVGQFNWEFEYQQKSEMAQAVRYFADKNIKITKGDFHSKLSELAHNRRDGWF
ncbi:alpha-(1,3)-fucosyltransferase 10-like [Mercenaria mercenaria]|uniref:alpha-(1,3)-fucosyltransferase 10-like n=1 Tax=Mercenaria mercenaria TaxID=6596 RepID=UPI00234F2100|nr:alpha-(1,3)-fucosyltransferase 10-like [Mercenaria mercenaria]